MGLIDIDHCMFECCRKDFNTMVPSNTFMQDSRARRRFFKQCEQARNNLSDGRKYSIDIVSLCRDQDYQCAVRRANHTDLQENWSPRMKVLKSTIEKGMLSEQNDEPRITTIILMGSWGCAKHNEAIVGRCIGCSQGMCQTCVDVGGKQVCQDFYRCEECGPVFWETEQRRRECN
jgi:hypothetical protein